MRLAIGRTQAGGVRVGHGDRSALLAGGGLDLLARPGRVLRILRIAVAARVGGSAALGLGAARFVGFPAGFLGATLGLGLLARFLGPARLFGAARFLGLPARLFRATGFLGLLDDGRVQVGDQARQALVVPAQLVGLGTLGGDLPFQLGQQRGALFLLADQGGLLLGGLGHHFFDLGATGVGLALQRGQPVDVGAQRLHRLGAGLGHVIQVAQIAAQQLRIVAGQQRRPGRQAAGVLGAQLVGQLDAALGQRRLLGADLLFQAAQVGLGLAIGLGQLAQPQIDAGNGRFGLFQRVGRFLTGGLARVDVFLQVLDAVAQLGLLALGLGLAPGQVIGAARAESVPPARTTANNNPDARRMTEPVST